MFQILLQECALIKKSTNIDLFFDKYLKIQTPLIYLKNSLTKNPVGLKPPSRLFLVLFMMCYHCIFLFKQKQILETNTGNKQFRLETTLPALFVVPTHDMLSFHVIGVQANTNTGKYRQIPEKIGNNTKNPLGSKPPSRHNQ